MKLNVWDKVKSLFYGLVHTLVPVLTGGRAVLAWVIFIEHEYFKYVVPVCVIVVGSLIVFLTPDRRSNRKTND